MMLNTVDPNKQRRWFSANGAVIALDAAPVDAVVADLQDSVLLHEHEPLLLVLAEALQADYDWQPVSEPKDVQLTHSISLVSDDTQILGVGVGREFHTALQQVGQRFESEVCITAHQQNWYFQTEHIFLNEAEHKELNNPGSVLLMPCGMDGSVSGQLRCDALNLPALLSSRSFTVDVASGGDAPLSGAGSEGSEADALPCKITLQGADLIDQREPKKTALLVNQNERARIEVQAMNERNTEYLADVIRIGEGLGLRIVER